MCANCGRDVRDGHFEHCPRPNDLNWKVVSPVTKEEQIVDAVLGNLEGRKGIGDELDAIDSGVYEEMKGELVDIVREILL